ncbi:hypothetical protein GBAR_LOCUS8021 [Geodia barretti]|uniref:Uncharacterized protein n=1 Tax=Geodia barretti TaxID=519541 RepID=A0AA35RJ58_GEOBA|nr:hypothetical protein GBAR_LOCUS8021 [Geodia barretti]
MHIYARAKAIHVHVSVRFLGGTTCNFSCDTPCKYFTLDTALPGCAQHGIASQIYCGILLSWSMSVFFSCVCKSATKAVSFSSRVTVSLSCK